MIHLLLHLSLLRWVHHRGCGSALNFESLSSHLLRCHLLLLLHHHRLVLVRYESLLHELVVRVNHAHHHVLVSSHHKHLLLRVHVHISLVRHHLLHLIRVHWHWWHLHRILRIVILLKLLLYVRMCTQFLITMSKDASLLVRTARF